MLLCYHEPQCFEQGTYRKGSQERKRRNTYRKAKMTVHWKWMAEFLFVKICCWFTPQFDPSGHSKCRCLFVFSRTVKIFSWNHGLWWFIKCKSAVNITLRVKKACQWIPVAPDDILRSYEAKRLVCARNWTLFATLLPVIQSLKQTGSFGWFISGSVQNLFCNGITYTRLYY